MAKTAKVKKRPVTIHSRAARRATSPSLALPLSATAKSPTATARRSTSPSRPSSINPHALAAKDAGIIKKQKKGHMTRAQRLRQAKGLERAADNMDKLELKRIKSFGKEKKVKERAKGWEDVNGISVKKTKKKDGDEKKDSEWVSDEEMDGDEAAPAVGEVEGEAQTVDTAAASIPLPAAEDELL